MVYFSFSASANKNGSEEDTTSILSDPFKKSAPFSIPSAPYFKVPLHLIAKAVFPILVSN